MPNVSSLSKGPPLGFAPPGASSIAAGVDLTESDDGSGAVFLWGMASWCWSAGDVATRRLAAVQLAATKAATAREVAAGFGIKEPTLWRWSDAYRREGVSGLMAKKKGPKGPSKLNPERTAEIAYLRAGGLSLRSIGTRVGVSHDSVLRALGPKSANGLLPDQRRGGDLVPLALPKDRSAEREAAHRGMLAEAAPVITEGASLPLAGALTILPALGATGLIDAASALYGAGRVVGGTTRAAFYGLRSLVLAVVFSALVGEPRAEGATRINPVSIGRLLGLDRAPEVSRLRVRMAELAAAHKADELVMALARRHTDAQPQAVGLLYVDGHVRAYHGKEEIPKAHVARMRIAMPAEVDTWICDRFGDGLLVWQAAPGASLVGELKLVTDKIRRLVGPDARPTIAFDRGGWSPKLFGGLETAGFDILTYRKAPLPREPRRAFAPYDFTDELGRSHHYLLADRRVAISYDAKKRRFACRQITRLDEATGHQTQILTTRDDTDPSLCAHAMFSRWRQENFFRYMRAHFALDALDAYETTPDDPGRMVANPAKRKAVRHVREAASLIASAEAYRGQASLAGVGANQELVDAHVAARAELGARQAAAKALPAKIPLAEIRPGAVRLDVERKRIMDAIRMATYNAESALARMIGPHYARAEDEARSLLHEIFGSPADLKVTGNDLHVMIHPLSAPRRTKALAALCEELNATETIYPGTELTLVYSVTGI
jgi:transposase